MKIGQLSASGTSTINTNYLPQFLLFHITGAANLSALKVTVEGDGVILDLDETGIDVLDGLGAVKDDTALIQLQVADGIIRGKTVQIVGTEDGGVAIDVFAFSLGYGSNYVRSMRNTVLANSGTIFRQFGAIVVGSMGDDDLMNVTYHDGHNQQLRNYELQGMTAFSQAVTAFMVGNLDASIDTAELIPTANRTVYKVDFQPVGNLT